MLTQATEMDYKCGSCMHGIRRFGTKEVLCVPATRLKFNEEKWFGCSVILQAETSHLGHMSQKFSADVQLPPTSSNPLNFQNVYTAKCPPSTIDHSID
jgi:hypothetical protein